MLWSDASDAALLAATRSDADAFGEFYDRYETAVIGYLLRRTGSVDVAIDLAGEVFAAALAGAHRYRPAGPTAAPWLFTIAQNTLTGSIRRGRVEARARRRIGIREAVEYGTDELERIEAVASQSDWATRLLAALPSDQREARPSSDRRRALLRRHRPRAEDVRARRPQTGQSGARHAARTSGGSKMTLLPEYRAQLHGAARQRTRRRMAARALPALAAVLVALGVVVAAVAVLRPRSAPAPVGAKRAAAPTRQLIDALGVLRRHQTGLTC